MDMPSETLVTLSWELYEQGIPKSHIAHRLGKHRETVHIWIKGIQRCGLLNFLDKYRQAKKRERKKRQVDPIVKRWVWEIREREYDCCGQKIQYFLSLGARCSSLCPQNLRDPLGEVCHPLQMEEEQ